MYFFYDSGISILLLILGFIICMFAQIKISSTYSKYKKIKGSIEKTGEDVATEILKRNGLEDIQVNCIAGNLTDHHLRLLHMNVDMQFKRKKTMLSTI